MLLVVDIFFLFFCINTVFDVYQDAGMLFSFCIILFIVSVKIVIQFVPFPRFSVSLVLFHQVQLIYFIFYFFICCVTSALVILVRVK